MKRSARCYLAPWSAQWVAAISCMHGIPFAAPCPDCDKALPLSDDDPFDLLSLDEAFVPWQPPTPKCDCGAAKVKDSTHSSWCSTAKS